MNQQESFALKNANRKSAKVAQGGWYATARRKRQRGFIGKDGTCLNGAFGNVEPGMYNELVQGTTGMPKELTATDLEGDE